MEKNKEYYEGLDKRTNEYKEWKQSQQESIVNDKDYKEKVNNIEEELFKTALTQEVLDKKFESKKKTGLGDVVETALKYVGIKQIVELFTPEGKDCGCDKRKEKLNNLFKYRTPLCLNVDEYETLTRILTKDEVIRRRGLNRYDQKDLLKVYNRIFNVKKDGSSCNDCLNSLLNELDKVYETYK